MTQDDTSIITHFSNLRILVVGDVMLDTYWWGDTHRISPEAPVPVVEVSRIEHRLGGAANVALNTSSLGATTFLAGVVGEDENAQVFQQILVQQNINTDALIFAKNRKTTQKNRILSRNQQQLRLDIEDQSSIDIPTAQKLLDAIKSIVVQQNIQAIILQDYDKGLFSESTISSIIRIAKQFQIPVAVDPKFKNFFHYSGAYIFKPNLKETLDALSLDFLGYEKNNLHSFMKNVLKLLQVEHLIITLSQHGIAGIDANNHFFHHPAQKRNIVDVSGAGDTVIALLALCSITKIPIEKAAYLANIAGGMVCERVGVTPITQQEMIMQIKALSGC